MKGSGDRLQRAIRRREFTSNADFARAVPVDPGTLRAQLSRNSVPKEVAEVYARKLRVPLEWLLYGKGKDPFEDKPGEPRSYTPPGFGTLKNESAVALELKDQLVKIMGLDLTREKEGELFDDSLNLVRKYKT